MTYEGPFKAALPCGVRDLFLEDAARLSRLMATWRQLFESWAYAEIIPPTYEHYDVLMAGSDADFERRIFRVLDREGNILALRPDITTQVARIVGTNQPGPDGLLQGYRGRAESFTSPGGGAQGCY